MLTILVFYDFDEAQLAGLREAAPGAELRHARTAEEAAEMTADAEVLLGYFPPSVVAAARRLRWIQSHSAGMDSFLYPEVIESDVVVTNMAGVYAGQGAEHAWALLLALARGIPAFVRGLLRREWWRGAMIEVLAGTVGVIGLGGFVVEMARRAQGYDMQVLAPHPLRGEKPEYVAELRRPSPEALADLLTRSDAVMIACPKTTATYHLIGAAELRLMKPTAFLINVTRGGIIDEAALAVSLREGWIAGAGLDVFEREPLPSDSPLWDCENCLITTD